VAAGRLLGPRYLIGGPFLDQNSIKSVGDVEPMLDLHVQKGFDYVKIHGDLPDDAYKAVMEGARKRNLLVTGHVQRHRPLQHSLGMYSIEHAEEFLHSPGRAALRNPVLAKAAAAEIKKSGLFVVPTLVVFKMIAKYLDDAKFARLRESPAVRYLSPQLQESWLSAEKNTYRRRGPAASLKLAEEDGRMLSTFTKVLHEAGVPLILATDVLGALVPGFSVHEELEYLVEAGLSPYEALRTGTVNVAAYLREPDAGTLEAGKRADFILVGGNPLRDIKAAADVRGVFVRGRWLPRAELEAMLQSVPRGYAEAGRDYAP
jgi:imidazolonepropionase-like amidohydrolase